LFVRDHGKFSRELNLKSFAQIELNHCHQRDGLRPGSIADANDQAQFGELTKRAWAKGVLGSAGDPPAFCGDSPKTFGSGHPRKLSGMIA
jgi:hypothetical protein